MDNRVRNIHLWVDGYTRFCLTAIVVLMTIMIVGLWAERSPTGDMANAAERYQRQSVLGLSDMVRVQERTIAKLDEIQKLLESGNVKVQVVEQPTTSDGGVTNVKPISSTEGGTSATP